MTPSAEAVEQWLRRKYVVRTNRGIDYMEAGVDDLAREINRYIATLAPAADAQRGEVDAIALRAALIHAVIDEHKDAIIELLEAEPAMRITRKLIAALRPTPAAADQKAELTEAERKLCREAWNAAQTNQSGDRFAPDVLRLVMLVNRLLAAAPAAGAERRGEDAK